MSDVEFNEEQEFNQSMEKLASRGRGKWSPLGMAIRWGLAKDETGANIVLSVIALVVVVLAVIIFLRAQ